MAPTRGRRSTHRAARADTIRRLVSTEPFRAILEETSRLARSEKEMQTFEQLLAFIEAHNTAVMGHTNQSLLDHLIGVRSLLVDWGPSDTLAAACLFHSVYGTESYRRVALPLDLRSDHNTSSSGRRCSARSEAGSPPQAPKPSAAPTASLERPERP